MAAEVNLSIPPHEYQNLIALLKWQAGVISQADFLEFLKTVQGYTIKDFVKNGPEVIMFVADGLLLYLK